MSGIDDDTSSGGPAFMEGEAVVIRATGAVCRIATVIEMPWAFAADDLLVRFSIWLYGVWDEGVRAGGDHVTIWTESRLAKLGDPAVNRRKIARARNLAERRASGQG